MNIRSEMVPIFYLNVFAVAAQLTIVAILLFRNNNSNTNKLLALIMFYPALNITLNIFYIIFQNHNLLFLSPLNISITLTFGPVLLAYIGLIQGKTLRITPRYWFHFLPAVLILFSTVYYFVIPEQERIRIMQQLLEGNDLYTNFINLLLLCHIMAYLIVAFRRVKQHAGSARNFYAYTAEIEVKWPQTIVNLLLLLNLLILLAYGIPIILSGQAHIYSDLVAAPVAAIILYVCIIYKGFSYHVIFDKFTYARFMETTAPIDNFVQEVRQKNKSGNRFEDIELIQETRRKIDALFSESKIHTCPQLKLHTVATMLNMSPAVLSRFINTHIETSFFDLVNTHRVEEAKKMLTNTDYQHYKIESIGEMAGFSSKASFFSIFKKHMNQTPHTYKKRHLSDKT